MTTTTPDITPEVTPFAEEPARPPSRDRRLVVVLLLVGVLVDLWWQTRADGLAAATAVLLTAGALVTMGPVRSTTGRVITLLAVLPAAFLAVRTSPWVISVDLVAVAALLLLGPALARRGSLFDLGFGQMARATGSGLLTLATTPPPPVVCLAGLRLPAGDRDRRAAVARGVFLAVPLALVLALVLASGDAVFASLFEVSIDPWWVVPHLLVVVLGSWIAAGAFAQGERDALTGRRPAPLRIGAVEGAVVLAGLIVVYALFAVARLLVALNGAEYVVESTGLTYAEYARSGFFQLLWAAGLTLVVLLALRATVVLESARSRRVFAGLSLVAVALTIVMVHSAVTRLGLYDDAFGLTMLRLCCTIFAWWIAAVFVLTGLSLAGVGRSRSWLPGAVLLLAVLTLLVFNLLDPEALVVERNVARAPGQEEALDVDYLVGLSDDAVPDLVDALPSLTPAERSLVLAELCDRPEGPVAWNLAAQRAEDARRSACTTV